MRCTPLFFPAHSLTKTRNVAPLQQFGAPSPRRSSELSSRFSGLSARKALYPRLKSLAARPLQVAIPPMNSTVPAIATALLLGLSAVAAQAGDYSLADNPLASSARATASLTVPPLQTSFSLAPRQELRLAATSANQDSARATYRYTLMEQPQWAWKVGLTSQLSDATELLRLRWGNERTRLGALPLMHMGGEARFNPRWRLAVDADGLLTSKGHLLDIGLRANYLISPSFSLYGGLRLSDSAGDAEDARSTTSTSTANVGVRLHF